MATIDFGESLIVFGTNADVDTGTEELVPVSRGTLPADEYIASIASSDNTNDKAAGTGALTARIHGIQKTTYAEIFEDVTLNGTSAVTTTLKFIRINKVEVLTAGSTGSNTGVLTTSLNAQVQDTISIARSNSHQAAQMVPAGSHAKIDRIEVNASLAYSAVTFEWRDVSVLGTPTAWKVVNLGGLTSTLEANRAVYQLNGAISVPPKSEWRVRVTSAVDNNVVSAVVYFINRR